MSCGIRRKGNCQRRWLISPELSGEAQTVSFYIKSVTMAYEERFRVLYSTDTKSTSDFVKVATANYYTPNSLWRRFSVKLPEGAKYFAIHCISEDAFGLMVDDITYIPKNAKRNRSTLWATTSTAMA